MLAAFGLGNPGAGYAGTRHNVGKEVIGRLLRESNLCVLPGRGQYYWAQDAPRGLYLVFPTTYVNTSGASAAQVIQDLGIGLEQLLVVCDDFSLPLGTLRIRQKGSDGGHRGLASLIWWLSSEDFPRLRIGVGPLPEGMDSAEFVLSKFPPWEEAMVYDTMGAACQAVITAALEGIERAMNQFNRRVVP